jgi:hypothetical protein
MGTIMQWVRLGGMLRGDFGVANMYTPNDSKTIFFLREEMGKALPNDCKWILKRGWNMVESRNVKSNELVT